MQDTAKTPSLRPDAAINTARVSLLRLARQIERADLTDTKQVAALRASIDQASDAFRTAVAAPGFDPAKHEGAQELIQALALALDPLRDLVARLSEHELSGGRLMTLTTAMQNALTRILTPTALFGSGVPIEGAGGAGAFLPIDEAVSIVTHAYGTLQVATEKLKVTGRELSPDAEAALFRVILAIERSGLVTSIDAGIFDFLPKHLAQAVTRDHHGIHSNPDRLEVSTTMLVVDEIERVRAMNIPAEEKIARLEHEYRYCVTDNLGDAILALVIARHIPELIEKGGLEVDMKAGTRALFSFDMLRRLAHFEDFGFFGSGSVGEGKKRSAPGEVVLRDLIHFVLGNFQVFDELLVKFGVKGSDRFDGLRPKAQTEIVEAAARGVEENLKSYATRLERARRFKASIDGLKREVCASHGEMRHYLEAHAVPATDMVELDSKVFYFFGTMTGGCFASWDAPALTHKRKIQWQSIRFDTPDGQAKWGFVLAVPSGRTLSFLDTSLVKAFGPRFPKAIARGDTLLFVFNPDDGDVQPEAMARVLAEELRNHEMKEPPVETAASAPFSSLVGENVISHDAYMYDDEGRYTWTPEAFEAAKTMAEEAFEVAVKNPACKNVVLIVGLPGAGKSTYVRAHDAPDTVYFDSTLTTPEKRRPLIRVAREAHKPVSIVWVDTPLETCLARNKLRTDREIPEIWMHARQAELDAEPPEVNEGVDRITIVRPNGGS